MRSFVFLSTLIFAAPLVAEEPANLWTRKAGVDWPTFLGPDRNGVSPEKGIITKWPKDGLRVMWEVPVGLGFAPPAISKGRLYHFDRFGDKARLTCRNAETGKPLWKFEYDTDYEDYYKYSPGPRACPVVDEERVYIQGPEGMLHCLDAIKGEKIWAVNTKAEFHVHQNFFGVGSVPVVEGDLLIVPVGGSPPGPRPDDLREVKGNGTGIVAFNKKTGEVKYKVSDALASYSSPVVVTMNGRRQGLYFARGGLIGFEPKSGTIDFEFKWRAKPMESVNASNPVVVGDKVLITECYEKGAALLKISPGKCEPIWTDDDNDRREKFLMCHWNTPIHHEGYVYGSSGRNEDATLRCIELATGKVMWQEPKLSRASLTMVDGHFLCLTEEGVLQLLKVNPKKYDRITEWKTELVYPSWAAPVLSHGLLYIRGKDRLTCAELIPDKK
jgi:outer membrane protein assembly factor BamB